MLHQMANYAMQVAVVALIMSAVYVTGLGTESGFLNEAGDDWGLPNFAHLSHTMYARELYQIALSPLVYHRPLGGWRRKNEQKLTILRWVSA